MSGSLSISKIKLPQSETLYTLVDEGARELIVALQGAMVFKGTVGVNGTITWANLPTPASTNRGSTYKVITKHVATPVCEVGDTIVSDGTQWVVIPSGDEPSGTVTTTGTMISGHIVTSNGGTVIKDSGFTIGKNVPSNAVFTDTTYAFSSGINKFTVTPSNGTAQEVAVTPSITNNVTGSGTNGYIAKFNGANTITNGPAIGTDTSTYLRNDGTWASPVSEVHFTLSTSWQGSSAPYTQRANISGLTGDTIGIVAVDISATQAQYQAAAKAQLRCTDQTSDKITMTAYGTKPTATIPCVVTILK